MQTKIVLATLFAAAVSAEHLLALMPRQTSSGGGILGLSKTCTDDLKSAQDAAAPTPAAQLIQSYVSAVESVSDPCKFTPSGALASSLASYESQASSWANAHKDLASKIEKDCSVDLANLLEAAAAACTNLSMASSSAGSGSGSSGAAASTTAGAGSSSGASSTSASSTAKSTAKSNGAAAGGPVAAGALLVGVLGAAIML